MSLSAVRSRIRCQIRPFVRVATYPTGWGGDLTFDQIADKIAPQIASKIKRFGVYGQNIPDCAQTGLMRLWLRLCDQADMLAADDLTRTVWRAIAVCGCTTLLAQNRRYDLFSDIEDGTGIDTDEYAVHGYDSRRQIWDAKERWAGYATATDVRIDLTAAIQSIAERYADDITGLVALYILMTDARPLETMAAHRLPRSSVYARVDQIRQRLHRLLAEYKPADRRTWRERFEEGEIAPYLEVVAHYEDRPLALAALYTLTTRAKVRHFARHENERRRLTQYRTAALKRIEAAYSRAASF
jgi:hypothetical protein